MEAQGAAGRRFSEIGILPRLALRISQKMKKSQAAVCCGLKGGEQRRFRAVFALQCRGGCDILN